jgi:ribonuclease J
MNRENMQKITTNQMGGLSVSPHNFSGGRNPERSKKFTVSAENGIFGLRTGRSKPPRYKDRRRDLPRPRRLAPVTRPEKESEESARRDTLKIIPLGGLGEIGRNMSVLEYKNDIIVIDVGLGFPEDDMPGIDYTLPNAGYLDGKQDKIRGIILTHGHMDHIGGLPYLIQRLGNPTVYASDLTRGLVIKRHQEFRSLPELDINLVHTGEKIHLGNFEIEFFHVNHNIPDDTALIIKTPAGRVVHTADFKFDPRPLNEKPADLEFIKSIGDRGVAVLMSDSTGAEKDGESISESVIQENLETIFKEATGMIIAGTFSSLINRIQQLIALSEKYGRKVIFDGFSLKSNVEIAKELNQIKIKKGTQIPVDQIDRYPRSKITVICTGAQGEGQAVLMRVASGEHRFLQIKKDDSVIFSSSVIPGNERTVQRLKDLFYRLGARVYHYGMMDIHASGHAYKEDLRRMVRLVRPKFLMPIHGHYSMMVNLGYIAQEEGIPEENIIIADNGSIIHIAPDEWWFDKKTAPADSVMVDGLGIGDIGNVVLRDRQVLAEDGMFVIVTLIDSKTGRVRGSPDIISRGFVYLKENKELLAQVRKKIKFIVERKTTRPINWVDLKDLIRDEIGMFLFQKTERRPMVLPVVIEI